MLKKLIFSLAMCVLASPAFAICTNVSVPATNTSTKVLAALDISPRRQLWFNGTSSCPAWCDVGNSSGAVNFQGYLVMPGNSAVYINPSQQQANSFPIAPSGEVDCVVPANMGCQSQNVTVCDF